MFFLLHSSVFASAWAIGFGFFEQLKNMAAGVGRVIRRGCTY
jgi:hypothetical protein